MIQVANPIYDIVFKYLMEDERIARTILSALLKKEVVSVEQRLKEAASDRQLRHDMNVEDEYFSAIENRDTEILMRDKQLAEQKAQIAEQQAQIETAINLLLHNGVATSMIAQSLNVDITLVETIAAMGK